MKDNENVFIAENFLPIHKYYKQSKKKSLSPIYKIWKIFWIKTNKNGFLGYNSIDLLTLKFKQTKKKKHINFECFKNFIWWKKMELKL